MATEEYADRPLAGPDPAHCRGAKDYALQRLESADSPLSPAGLADEYDCSGTHMRSVLSELARKGEVDREGQGQYVAVESEAETDNSNGVGDADEPHGELPSDDPDEFTSTAEAYDEQYSGVSDGSDGEDAGDDAGSEVEAADADDPAEASDQGDGDGGAAAAAAMGAGGGALSLLGEDGPSGRQLVALAGAAALLYLVWRAGHSSDSEDGTEEPGGGDGVVDELEENVGGLAQPTE